jgi:hypothetical protein
MKPASAYDRVILKRSRTRPYELLAFLPDVAANPGKIVCYVHVGQHSEASYHFYSACCRPVKPDDSEAINLLLELQAVGYRPRLMRRIAHHPRRGARC